MVILNYDLLKHNGKFSKPMVSRKKMTRILYGKFEKKKRFLKCKKMASRIIFRHILYVNIFMFFAEVQSKLFKNPLVN